MKTKHNEVVVYDAVTQGLLEIDPLGRIWKIAERRGNRWGAPPKIRKVTRRRAEHDTGTYLQVRWMVDRKRTNALAHRLVWMHFNGRIPGTLTINHKNGDKQDNRLENLELVTYSENAKHAARVLKVGHCANQWGEQNYQAKLTEKDVAEIRRRRAAGERLIPIAKDFRVTYQTISKIARGDSRPVFPGQ